MTKVTIIEVDLGASIQDIINDDVTKLTAENRTRIDEIIKEAAQKQEAQEAVKNAVARAEAAVNDKLTALYNRLLGEGFVPTAEIISTCAPEMPNMISVSGRMRKWLMMNGHGHKLKSCKQRGVSGYRLSITIPEEVQQEIINDRELNDPS